MIEHIEHDGELLALIIRASFSRPGITFFTENSLSQQIGYMQHPSGKLIEPHVHLPVAREVHLTQEVLVLRKGTLRVDFYDERQVYLYSRTLNAGDVILLIKGGHGFEVIEEVEMFEIKQGPYAGDQDKTRFSGISAKEAKE
ncbi:cupin domain-containing protein [Thalassospira povalilytica]|uniref:Mannose-6-phosphate isomerase type II C-terminal domain-containing protein n=1 Tax=Thalassospira povalilytica TaxID=732237 RepID=A0ABX4RC15_9PROT|nr:hypothetical protein [Thalassospira povalilytica]PKR51230.1 hypothetical protein CU041_06835 [Thalassospira povalilytica]